MKILLLNDNPVVNKLVTLSAQKTSDKLDVVSSIEEVQESSYDLLIVDDTLYQDDTLEKLQEKTTFIQSLLICARDKEEILTFSKILKKPFLPTDLVELFSKIGQETEDVGFDIDTEDESSELEVPTTFSEDDSSGEFCELEDLSTLDGELGELEDLDSFDEMTLDDDEKDIDVLDDELSPADEETTEGILDIEEAQKVNDLLDEEESDLNEDLLEDDSLSPLDEIESDDDDDSLLPLDEEESEEMDLGAELEEDDDLSLPDEDLMEDALSLDEEEAEEMDLGAELEEDDDLSLPDEDLMEDALSLDEEESEEMDLGAELEEDDDLESQIENAVADLSEEELESEVDQETLIDMVHNDIDSFDSLTSKDLKIAIGEEITEEDEIIEVEKNIQETDIALENIEGAEASDVVEPLKKLLKALSDKDVAASLKGMKINISITLGDE